MGFISKGLKNELRAISVLATKVLLYVHSFQRKLGERSDMSPSVEAFFFLLTKIQHLRCHDVADVQSDCRQLWFILTTFKVNVIIGM